MRMSESKESRFGTENYLKIAVICFLGMPAAWFLRKLLAFSWNTLFMVQLLLLIAALVFIFIYGMKTVEPYIAEDWEAGEQELKELTEILEEAKKKLEERQEKE